MKKIYLLIIFFLFFIKVKANNLSADSYILMNIDTLEVIKEKNKDKKKLTASIAKIMTAIVVIENTNLSDEVKIIDEDILQEGSSIYLKTNTKITVEDLLYGLLLRSGNDCANALSRHTFKTVENFVSKMNEYAKKLNMKNTVFSNPSGLDSINENYSTSYDMALLMSYCYKNETFRKINNTKTYIFKDENNKITNYWSNKHKLIRNGIANGGKTGYTKKAGRTLVSTYNNYNLNFVVVTFESSNDWNEHKYLFEYGKEYYPKKLIIEKDIYQVEDKIFIINEDFYLNISMEEINNLKIIIFFYKEEINEIIGELNLLYKDKKIYTTNVKKYNPLNEKENINIFINKIIRIIK